MSEHNRVDRHKKATCKKCGAINEYSPNDERVLHKVRTTFLGFTTARITIKGLICGQCEADVITEFK